MIYSPGVEDTVTDKDSERHLEYITNMDPRVRKLIAECYGVHGGSWEKLKARTPTTIHTNIDRLKTYETFNRTSLQIWYQKWQASLEDRADDASLEPTTYGFEYDSGSPVPTPPRTDKR